MFARCPCERVGQILPHPEGTVAHRLRVAEIEHSTQVLAPLRFHQRAPAVLQDTQQTVVVVKLKRSGHAVRSIGPVADGSHSRAGLEHQLQDTAGARILANSGIVVVSATSGVRCCMTALHSTKSKKPDSNDRGSRRSATLSLSVIPGVTLCPS